MSIQGKLSTAGKLAAAAAAVYGVQQALQAASERAANQGLARGNRILVLGGGFAGIAVCQELARLLPDTGNGEIVLVDEDNYLLFTPMLTEAAGGELDSRDIISPIRSGAGRRVRFVQGRVTSIDLAARSVTVETDLLQTEASKPASSTQTLTGDHLVIALGSVVNFHSTPGVAEHAIPMRRLPDATRAFEHVSAAIEQASVEADEGRRRELLTFVVGGGGYTGVETMAAINDLVRSSVEQVGSIHPGEVRTMIIDPGARLLPEITPDLAAFAAQKLQERGVEIRFHTRIESAGAGSVTLAGGETIPTRTLIWAAGVSPNPLLEAVPAAKGKHHGLQVDGTCQVPGFPGVWALGDCAEIPEPDGGQGTYAPTAQNATREGTIVARNLVRSLRGEPLEPFRYTPMGELAIVGRRSGVARVFGLNFSGPIAWAMWRLIYLAKMPGLNQQSRILATWVLDAVFGRPAIPLSSGR